MSISSWFLKNPCHVKYPSYLAQDLLYTTKCIWNHNGLKLLLLKGYSRLMRLWFSFSLRPLLTLVESKESKWNTDMPYTHFKKPLHKREESPLSGKKRSWTIYHIMTSSLFSSYESLLLCFTRTSASQWNCCRHDEKLILEYTVSHIHLPQNLSLPNPGAIPTSSFPPSFMEVNLKRSFLLGDIQQLVSCYYTCCFSLRDIIVLLKTSAVRESVWQT